MRAVVQRVKWASVSVDGEITAKIAEGILVLLGISDNDSEKDMDYIADKCINLRIFDDSDGVMNLSLADVGGEVLLVSQFTLYGDARKGRRPSYIRAAKPDDAKGKFSKTVQAFEKRYDKIKTGVFQAMMEVELLNDGPVTILIDSERGF